MTSLTRVPPDAPSHRRHPLRALLALAVLGASSQPAVAAILAVDNTVVCSDVTGTPYCTIGAAIAAAAASGDTITVAAGTYPENLILAKSVTLTGAQQGVPGCNRVASETIITDASGGTLSLLNLRTGSAGSIIDGLTFSGPSGPTGQLESTSGPIHNVQILHNRFVGFNRSGVFLNDPGTDITVDQNEIDGSAKITSGDLFHLDTDAFPGFHFTSNCVRNGATATGFFVDGNHNVGSSAARAPLFSGNLIDKNNTGTNLGTRAFTGFFGAVPGIGLISDNTFSNNNFDGLQGGIQHTSITNNNFVGNGRHGLALTSFGNTGADRGGQFDTVTQNGFCSNGFGKVCSNSSGTPCTLDSQCPSGGTCTVALNGAGILFSATQAVGTIATNVANNNNIAGNFAGATYNGIEIVDATNNWWGCPTGANTVSCDTAGSSATLLTTPFLAAPEPTAIQCPAPPTTTTTTTTTSTTSTTESTTTTTTSTTSTTESTTTSTTSTTTSSTTTTTSSTTTTTLLDHVQCYEIKPAQTPPVPLTVEDQFGTLTETTRYPHRLCAPANKNGEGIIDPVQHLTGYVMTRASFAKRPNQTIVNQFGTVKLDVLRPNVFMVPSAKSLTGPASPLVPPTIDHFQCYKVKPTRGAPKFVKRTVDVVDQFEHVSALTLVRPYLLCAPANKNGEVPTAPSHPRHLLCYKTRSSPGFGTTIAFIDNQFGPDQVTLIHRRELCVPSLKNP